MENNKSKSSDDFIFLVTCIIAVVVLLILSIYAIMHRDFDQQRYKNIAYISIPGKESYIKEVKHYNIYNGGTIVLTLTDGTKITTSTRNVTLVKSKKGINNENKCILK